MCGLHTERHSSLSLTNFIRSTVFSLDTALQMKAYYFEREGSFQAYFQMAIEQ